MDFKNGEDVLALKAVVQDIADPTSDGELPEEADEYARDTGLTVDSRKWPTAINHDMLMASTLAPTRPGRLLELPHLPECTFRSIIPLPEQLIIPKTATEFGEQLIKACDEADVADLMNELSHSATSDTKFLKLEEPVLRSNPQADQRALASKLAAFRKTPLPSHRLPLHPVNIEDDEGLEFPPSARRGHKSLMDTMKKQRYDAKFSMVSYIHKTNEAPWSDDEQRQVFDNVSTYKGLADQGYVTPPLSPRIESHTEPADHFVPDTEICLVPEPSPVCSKLETDIEAAEKRIFKADTDFWESLLSGDSYSLKSCGFEYDDLDISGMIRAGEIPLPDHVYNSAPKAEALKLEIPLLPDDKHVDPAEEPQRIIKPDDLEQAKELIKSEDDPPMADQKFSDFLQSKSDKMMRSAEQEKLSSIDSTARVPIPVMDFSVPKPDWIQDGCDTPAKMFTWIKRHTGHINWNPVRWPSNRAAEQRMIWSPIAHIWDTKKLVSEKIEVDDELLGRFMVMTLDRDVMSSTDYVTKHHGLAILGDYDLDDELLDEVAVFERRTGLYTIPIPSQGTIRLRDSVSSSYNMPFLAGSWTQDLKNPQEIKLAKKRARRDSDEEDGWMEPAAPPKFARKTAEVIPSRDSQAAEIAMIDSASALLSFVDDKHWDDHSKLVQNHAKRYSVKKPKVNSRFFGPSQDAIQDYDLQSQARKKEDDDAKAMPPPPPVPKPIPALAPSFTLPNAAPPKIIVASSVSHMLILELRNLIPGLGVITRDYGKWAPNRSRSSSSDLAATTMEADITLSPATGIMLTTMVKLRQKSLPASQGGSDFRSLVENVANKYETLLVLISEGNKHSESITPLNNSDANALVEFRGFVAGFSSEISVMYIGGGQETLAKWVASSISQHANEGALVQDPLLEEETCWEVFLRMAGMNSFGAQAVLGLLKNPEADDEEQTAAVGATAGRLYGLPLFVMMSLEERVVMFADIFGGREVLQRVSEVLDWEWGVRSRGVNGLDGMVPSQAEERSWAWGGFQNRI